MIQDFFGFHTDPFSLRPDLEFRFQSTAHEEAVAHLVYGIEQNEDIILICGDIGTGKTLALHFLLEEISKSFLPVFINVTTLDFQEILRLVLRKMNVKVPQDGSAADLIHALETALEGFRKQGKKILLVIDEAQNLPTSTLESTRLLLNLAQPGGQALQLVLAGQLGLLETLQKPEMRQLSQRIRVEYQLDYLSRSELDAYIQHRLSKAGCNRAVFRKDALDRIFELSKGVPRVVNHLANNGLLAAYVEQKKQVTANHVEEIKIGNGPFYPTETEARSKKQEPVQKSESDIPGSESVATAKPVSDHRRQEILAPEKKSSGRGLVLAIILIILATAGYFTYPRWSHVLGTSAGSASLVAPAEQPQSPPPAANEALPEPLLSSVIPAKEEAEPQVAPAEPDSPETAETNPVATLEETPAAPVTRPEETRTGPVYLVHVASFRDAQRAANLHDQLVVAGIENSVEATIQNERVWHRILVGPFRSKEMARSVTDSLKESGTIIYSKIFTRDDPMNN